MRIIVLGGVAAGTKTAAKLMREDRTNDVTLFTKGKDISYAGCGLPYYISGMIADRDSLVVNTPEKFTMLTGVKVRTGMEAVKVDPENSTVTFADGTCESYDRLVIATGASPIVPPVKGTGLSGVFTLRTVDDAVAFKRYAEENGVKRCIVAGASFIGLEAAENLKAAGVDVTVIDKADQVLPGLFDPDMAAYLRKQLTKAGIRTILNSPLVEILGEGKVTGVRTAQGTIEGTMVVLALGIRPNTSFLEGSGIELEKGAILVDEKQKTNVHAIYAAGDCALVRNALTGKRQYSAMGSTANITGRIAARAISGEDVSYRGCLGTAVIRLMDGLNAGRTGLTEIAALDEGFDAVSVSLVVDDKAHYYPGSGNFVIKLVADKTTHAVLGVQVAGPGAVDKIVDTCVAGIMMKARLEDYDSMDLSYAPPFSTAINPLVQACYVLENKINGVLESITPY